MVNSNRRSIFAIANHNQGLQPKFRRDGRVVDYSSLENYRAARHRGFESLSLRKVKLATIAIVASFLFVFTFCLPMDFHQSLSVFPAATYPQHLKIRRKKKRKNVKDSMNRQMFAKSPVPLFIPFVAGILSLAESGAFSVF